MKTSIKKDTRQIVLHDGIGSMTIDISCNDKNYTAEKMVYLDRTVIPRIAALLEIDKNKVSDAVQTIRNMYTWVGEGDPELYEAVTNVLTVLKQLHTAFD